ncbi:hypothetical protein HYV86_02040 [Candidatus Woesearchaeota archaeon]|nr:hypothetical protein [Candidatus Woesearchaeota archaeon]
MVSIDTDVEQVLGGRQFLVVGSADGRYDALNALGHGVGLNRSYGSLRDFVGAAGNVANGFDLRLGLDGSNLRLYDGDKPTGLTVKPIYTRI